MKNLEKSFLIFSGHNERAVWALCRFFCYFGYDFKVVARDEDDFIFDSPWSGNVSIIRKNKSISLELFREIRSAINNARPLVYCPTTEYINNFVLQNRNDLEALGYYFCLPSFEVYSLLTNKKSSLNLVKSISILREPDELVWGVLSAPCVFKPKNNITSNVVNYPQLCFNDEDIKERYANLNPDEWFLQKYIEGQSYYLCGYISKKGKYKSYWQENYIQQANGKSIVLAKTCKSPGFDEERFFDRLIELEFNGPLMMEIIKSEGSFYYIEINPRFWGPLQLALDACPDMLQLFAEDAEIESDIPFDWISKGDDVWYSWAEGAKTPNCHFYPVAKKIDKNYLNLILSNNDVYGSKYE